MRINSPTARLLIILSALSFAGVSLCNEPDDDRRGPASAPTDATRPVAEAAVAPTNARGPENDEQLRQWLENMVWYHGYSVDEITSATALAPDAIKASLENLRITPETKPARAGDAPLLVLPYPGGRHPRIGFLEGAIRPQRETKVSVFAPWDESSYAVVDIPEAIWSNLGLTYLAHTHIPTIWDEQNTTLAPLEWQRQADGSLVCQRTLPNGIVFGTKVMPAKDAVHMEMWLTNGTSRPLSDLRVQNCVMLKGMPGFDQQTNDNKVLSGSYAACRSPDGRRWVITAWDPLHRTWANVRCPCLHSDPRFPDCQPGQTQRLRGWLSFYEGTDIHGELRRIEQTGWRKRPFTQVGQTSVRGAVSDADTGQLIAARIHIQGADGQWYFAETADSEGSAVHYKKQPGHMPRSVEMHTTLSAHPFRIQLPAGEYTFRVERGKEYLPVTQQVTVAGEPVELQFPLRRWIDMAARGWYSGDTHVHRALAELPNVMLAEDLNVALPLSYWVREAGISPARGDRSVLTSAKAQLIQVDDTHVIYPMNTEYEIFTVGQRRHTLGAVFVLNHTSPLSQPAPPVQSIAQEARRQGALLDLDKHSWPWSLMLVPVMNVDLFELANNHMWQTEFGFNRWTHDMVAAWMELEENEKGFTEWGWIDFGLKTYYTLLNCGFRMRVTAGTASGVHPVQLGFGRVYVHLPNGFDYDAWVAGLNAGRSFVTTGPMLQIKFDGQDPGTTFQRQSDEPAVVQITGHAHSMRPLEHLQVVVNGRIQKDLGRANTLNRDGSYQNPIDTRVELDGSSWVAVRCIAKLPGGRVRFAHTNPVHVDIDGKPLRPYRQEVDYFIRRMQEEIKRNQDVLDASALLEYQQALEVYQRIAKSAR